MLRILFALSCLVSWCGVALAGAVFELEATVHDPQASQVVHTRIATSGGNLKMSVTTSDAHGSHDMIYHGAEKKLLAVSHPERMYVVMDEENMKGLQTQMDEAMSQMKKALENLPEDQRAMAEKMMKSTPMAETSTGRTLSALKVRETQERDTINGYDCVKYELAEGDDVLATVWVTDWKNVEGGEELAPVLREFAAFLEDSLGNMASRFGVDLDEGPFAAWRKIDGCPVKSEQWDDGQVKTEAILKSAHQQDVEASEFEPPAGYRAQTVPSGKP
jgi:hypothetical protein